MSTEPLDERADRAQAALRRRRDALTAATEAAQSGTTTYQTAEGDIRVTVTGRLRIGELYVSDRALRSPEIGDRLVAAVNEAVAAARDEHAGRLAAQLDADTAALVAAAEQVVETVRDGAGADATQRSGGYR